MEGKLVSSGPDRQGIARAQGRAGWLAGLAGLLGLMLMGACAGPPREPGEWQELPMEGLHLAPVALRLTDPPADPEDSKICRNAREKIQQHLVRALPGRLRPVSFLPPGRESGQESVGKLEVILAGCRLESHQWNVGGGEPDITFYLTLLLEARLRAPDGSPLFRRRFQTVEQVQTDIPTPVHDFFHTLPAGRIYGLFSRGRYWRSAAPGP